MARVKVDGNKLVECGEEIIRLTNEYNQLINDLFAKITSIQATAWTGNGASKYVARVRQEKNNYVVFGNCIRSYGSAIKNAGQNFNYIIDKWM